MIHGTYASNPSHEEVASFAVRKGIIRDRSDQTHPSFVLGWESPPLDLREDATHFGIVVDGVARVKASSTRPSTKSAPRTLAS